MKRAATLLGIALTSKPAPAHAQEEATREARVERAADVGFRFGYALPLGAIDAATRANDLSHGGAPLGLDATLRATHGPWSLFVGGAFVYALTIPRLCGSVSDCESSLGHDVDLLALARLRGPRWRALIPEAELGTGWSWSARTLADAGATSTRRFSGPVLLHVAATPSLALGSRVRLGLVVGGSLVATSSSTLEAPGVTRDLHEGARLHGTLDIAVRTAIELF
jgi:hypothetical protein